MSNHLDELTIKAFRQFEDVTFTGLSRVNLLVGENNSGKSSVLEAIEYLCNPMDPLAILDIARRREITTKDLDPATSLRWLFRKAPYDTADEDFLKTEMEVTGVSGDTQRTAQAAYERFLTDVASIHWADDSSTGTSPPPEADLRRKGVHLKLSYVDEGGFATEAHTLLEGTPLEVRSSVKRSGIPAAVVTSVSHRLETSQTRKLSQATIDYLKADTITLLQLIDPDIRDVEILDTSGRSVIWLDLLGLGFIPLSVCGDGLRRVLSFATSLSLAQTGLLLIDEIETALHKDTLVQVFKWLVDASKQLDVQILATTHSLEAVDAILGVSLDNLEDLTVFQLPDHGKQGIKRFAGDVLENIRFEQRLDVR